MTKELQRGGKDQDEREVMPEMRAKAMAPDRCSVVSTTRISAAQAFHFHFLYFI
jgi:hypothetical protein